jgi:hypothetical protein
MINFIKKLFGKKNDSVQENIDRRISKLETAKEYDDSYLVITNSLNKLELTIPVKLIKCTDEEIRQLSVDLTGYTEEELQDPFNGSEYGELYYIRKQDAKSENLDENNFKDDLWTDDTFDEEDKKSTRDVLIGKEKRFKSKLDKFKAE